MTEERASYEITQEQPAEKTLGQIAYESFVLSEHYRREQKRLIGYDLESVPWDSLQGYEQQLWQAVADSVVLAEHMQQSDKELQAASQLFEQVRTTIVAHAPLEEIPLEYDYEDRIYKGVLKRMEEETAE